MNTSMRITIIQNGPYHVEGGIPLYEDAMVQGNSADGHMVYERVRDFGVADKPSYLLCRCGRSSTMPFCDGTHVKVGFKGEEVADRRPYAERVQTWEGPRLRLTDDLRCAYARFCHRLGSEVWTLTESADSVELEENAVAAAWECPTGRLRIERTRDGHEFEQDFEPSIVVLEDVEERASGPLFVRGGIPLVGADGNAYEPANRYALCRCGLSRDVPFCDASHVSYGFYDGSRCFEGRWEHRDTTIEELPDLERPRSGPGRTR